MLYLRPSIAFKNFVHLISLGFIHSWVGSTFDLNVQGRSLLYETSLIGRASDSWITFTT